MLSIRSIKTRISSVKATRQITKAMYLVSSAKLQKARQKLMANRPFYLESRKVISNIVGVPDGAGNKYIEKRPVKNTLIVVISGDRGLCGGYNANVSKLAYGMIKDKNDISVITIGSKARDFMRRRKVNMIKSITGISEKPFYSDAAEIGEELMQMYETGKCDEIYLVYTEFKSTMTHIPKAVKLLPLEAGEFAEENEKKRSASMMFEPSPDIVLDYVIPKYVNTIIYGALTESSASEQGARMTAMDSSSKNADKMIEDYTVLYNRARQSAITQEIIEIVSGSEALK